MSDVAVTINGLRYRLTCEEGEQEHVARLASHIDDHVLSIKRAVGSVGNDRLLVMAALMIADELWDAKNELRGMQTRIDQSGSPQLLMDLQALVGRVEAIQQRLIELDEDVPYDDFDYYQEA
ncbi:MAG: cell division protein ZapA [Methyloligellaceae bacterium]